MYCGRAAFRKFIAAEGHKHKLTVFVRFASVAIWIDGEDGNECELSFELLAAHRTRVLELTQPLVGKGMQVGHTLTQGTLPPVGFGVLLTREPAEKVGGTVVLQVRDEMMTMSFIFSAGFGVGENRARTVMSKRHSTMA